jgi:2-octaprenyl-6-methoxyphenol hydroxylase
LSVEYTFSDAGVAATLTDGQVIHARSVIAADGRGSPAREAAGLSIKKWDYSQVAAVGIVRHSRPHENVSTELHTETGPYTFVPMEDKDGEHRSSFVCALSPEDADRLRTMDLENASRFLQARSHQLMGSLRLEAPVQLWPLESLVANAFAAKGVFLIGETAHAFPPIGAQGLNLSIRDVHDAVTTIDDALLVGDDPSSMLIASRYTAKRRADVWARTYGVDVLNRSLLSRSPLMHVARALAMGATRVSPSMKKGLMMAGLEAFSLRNVASGMAELLKPGLPRRSVS